MEFDKARWIGILGLVLTFLGGFVQGVAGNMRTQDAIKTEVANHFLEAEPSTEELPV